MKIERERTFEEETRLVPVIRKIIIDEVTGTEVSSSVSEEVWEFAKALRNARVLGQYSNISDATCLRIYELCLEWFNPDTWKQTRKEKKWKLNMKKIEEDGDGKIGK